jgi:hypothetical protein
MDPTLKTVTYWKHADLHLDCKEFFSSFLLYSHAPQSSSYIATFHNHRVRLVPVMGCLLSPSTMLHQLSLSPSTTSPPATACISLQYPAHNHISISHISLLSPSQLHHFRLNYFMDNEFEKTIA